MNTSGDRTAVYLVDDHAIVRSGVRAELETVPGFAVVGDAGTVADAVAGIRETDPDVVLLDVHMPDGGGLAVLRTVLEKPGGGVERPRFLGLSVSDDPVDVIALIRGGARGYVTKSIDIAALADAVRRVGEGDAVFSPKLAGYVLDAFASPARSGSGAGAVAGTGAGAAQDASAEVEGVPDSVLINDLTPREVEVMRLLARGYTYREMAERLFISVKTVETHVSHVLRKTQQTNRHQLSRWVSDNRLG
ncbi:response regulator transcription factor [uncultured Corynebacterium sp.]|uniref:response regulator n=1 Tax=uncultured Corynebacterium sp. TaxID=159447 RepID=UPI0025EF8C95|nr:response regulator transcription factor [uncultured Corynebacterium sp.]